MAHAGRETPARRRNEAKVMKFANLLSDYRRWGLARAFFIRVMSGLDRYAGLHLYRVFVRPLTRSHPPMDAHPRISISMARPEELYKAAEDPDLDLAAEFVTDALARGDRAFAAFDGEDLVAYTWRTSTAAPHADGLWVKVVAPYCYGYKAFTRESHRGRHLSGAMSFFSDAYGLERGSTTHVGFVELSNYASLAVEKTKRTQAAGYVGYANCFGRIIPFRSPAARKVGLELFLKAGKLPRLVSGKGPSLPIRPTS